MVVSEAIAGRGGGVLEESLSLGSRVDAGCTESLISIWSLLDIAK